jgi:hypothetical protein
VNPYKPSPNYVTRGQGGEGIMGSRKRSLEQQFADLRYQLKETMDVVRTRYWLLYRIAAAEAARENPILFRRFEPITDPILRKFLELDRKVGEHYTKLIQRKFERIS